MSRLVFDIGGTNMRLARAEGQMLHDKVKVPTPHEPQEAMERVRAYLAEHGEGIVDSVGGVAGTVDGGCIVRAPHLPHWDGFNMQAAGERLGLPLALYNDTAIACLGEARLGAGKGYEKVAYLAIGTGVGGALYADGVLTPHEPGHEVKVATGRTLEQEVSGSGLEAIYGKPAQDLPASIYEERTELLIQGITALIAAWMPQVFVLNGSLMNELNGFSIERIKRSLRDIPGSQMVPLELARFRDESGLYGAAVAQAQGR